MSYCPQCRTPLQPGARFCANCGHVLATAPPGYQQAPPGYGQPPPGGPAGWGAPAGGQPPPPAPLPMPPAPAPSGGGGSGMKVLGGCGVAGCLGVALAGIALVGLIFVIVLLGSSDSGSGGPTAGRSGELPGNGSLRDLVRPSVGRFSLISTAPVTKLGDRISPGVVDSLGAFYRSPDGSQLVQILLVYSSPSVAEERMQSVFDVALATLEPGQKVTRGQIKNSSGEVIGSSIQITGGAQDHVYWSNGKLMTFATANTGYAVEYYEASPY